MGLSPDVFADPDDDRKNDKLTYLKIKYLCLPPDETILVEDKKGNEIIPPLDLSAGVGFDTFVIFKEDFSKNKFKSKIFLTAVGTGDTEEIHTSNSQVLFVTQTFGCYEIVDIFTEDGNNFWVSKSQRKIKF